MYRLLLLAALAALAALALLGPSVEAACACPTPKTQANFDADKVGGRQSNPLSTAERYVGEGWG